IKPEIVAFDLHPDYLSTKFAKSLNISNEIGVQHHYAHMASFLAQGKPNGKVIGVTFDGTGFGLDGNIWGGEFLIGDLTGFERKGHLKYVPMPGGERAIKEPWRMAASWLYQIYGEDFLNLRIKFVDELDRSKWAILKKMIDRKINSPLTSSIGRLFDAVSSLIGIRGKVEYEAQAAIELEGIAEKDVRDFYEFNIEPEGGLYVIDPSPIFISIVEDLRKNIATSVISARFHNSISRLINEVCMKLRDSLAIEVVVLSGGVFLNRYLVNKVKPQLVANGFKLLEDDRIPVGDSGISIGQALIADRRS
ncbi:MAG: carbamoyltransferase HypF, partial [Candidatus Omnitrophota bacterium]